MILQPWYSTTHPNRHFPGHHDLLFSPSSNKSDAETCIVHLPETMFETESFENQGKRSSRVRASFPCYTVHPTWNHVHGRNALKMIQDGEEASTATEDRRESGRDKENIFRGGEAVVSMEKYVLRMSR